MPPRLSRYGAKRRPCALRTSLSTEIESKAPNADETERRRESIDGRDLLGNVCEATAAHDDGVVAIERPTMWHSKTDLLEQRRHQDARKHAAAQKAHDQDQHR